MRFLAEEQHLGKPELKHFLNITHLVVPIPEDKPSEEELFGPHWARYGR